MSALVIVGRENDLVIATDDRLTISPIDEGDTDVVDGIRKLYPIGKDRVLMQGSTGQGGVFGPAEAPELWATITPDMSVRETADHIQEWTKGQGRELYLFVAGTSPAGPEVAFVHPDADEPQFTNHAGKVTTVGLKPLSDRLFKPMLVPSSNGNGEYNAEKLPGLDPSELSMARALDLAVFMLQFGAKYQTFMPRTDLGAHDYEGSVIGRSAQVAVLQRKGMQVQRDFLTFGNPLNMTQHVDL